MTEVTIKSIEKEFFNGLSKRLDELFPKKKCKKRGRALVLNAFANIIFRKKIKKVAKKIIGEKEKPFSKDKEDWVNARNNLRYEQELILKGAAKK